MDQRTEVRHVSEDRLLVNEIRGRLDEGVPRWRPGAAVEEVAPLTGGASSLTYVVTVSGVPTEERRFVLKVAPPGLEPVRNRDVLRQARLLAALERAGGVRTPRLLLQDEGDPPAVPPYLGMSLVPGECVEPVLTPVAERPAVDEVRARAFDAARALAELHSVKPADLGLTGEPVVSLDQEIDRWTKAFETVPAELQGEYVTCAELLHATTPAPMEPVVNHGDYRLGNTLCQDGRVTAIIDWEIWSVGDPRVDVTWLTFFTDEAAHPAAEPGKAAGTPTKAELISAYEHWAGWALPDMEWFDALTKYKEAAATGLLLKRASRGGALPPPLRRMQAAVPQLVSEALQALR
jgi:aminoglycoside phosphotransferase (APT) family kinase protein